MAAKGEERNRFAGQLLNRAVIVNKTVMAVVPCLEVAAFFELATTKSSVATTGVTRGGINCGVSTEATGVDRAETRLPEERFALPGSRRERLVDHAPARSSSELCPVDPSTPAQSPTPSSCL